MRGKIDSFNRGHEKQVSSLDHDEIIAQLKARMDAGGMALVVQETYPNDLTEYVDLVLPAATWCETDLTRAQGERRLRIYSQFYDPPGSARTDWWIIGQIATKMGYEGFTWKDGNAVFEEAAACSKGGHYDYTQLIAFARLNGLSGHEQLRTLSTTGIQLPARLVEGELVGTVRLHEKTITDPKNYNWNVSKYKTKSGKVIFMRSDWRIAEPIFEKFKPQGDELWVLNGRINHIWQTMYDDLRKPYIRDRWPINWPSLPSRTLRRAGLRAAIWCMSPTTRSSIRWARPAGTCCRWSPIRPTRSCPASPTPTPSTPAKNPIT